MAILLETWTIIRQSLHESHSINKRKFFFFLRKKQNKFSFQNFFLKCKLCIVWNWFIAKIILLSQKYLFYGYLKWWQIKQCSRLVQGFVIKFLVAKCKPCEIYRRMCTEKHALVKKKFTNELNMGLSLQAWVEKTVYGVDTDSPVKKRIQAKRCNRKQCFQVPTPDKILKSFKIISWMILIAYTWYNIIYLSSIFVVLKLKQNIY